MKNLISALLVLFSLAITCCNEITSRAYKVHEDPTQFEMDFELNNISKERIGEFLDSIIVTNEKKVGICNPAFDMTISNENSKVISFSKPDCKYYFVVVNESKILVKAIFAPNVTTQNSWLVTKNQISDSLEIAFRTFFLDSVISKISR